MCAMLNTGRWGNKAEYALQEIEKTIFIWKLYPYIHRYEMQMQNIQTQWKNIKLG